MDFLLLAEKLDAPRELLGDGLKLSEYEIDRQDAPLAHLPHAHLPHVHVERRRGVVFSSFVACAFLRCWSFTSRALASIMFVSRSILASS